MGTKLLHVCWVQNRDKNRFRLAVGSFIEDHNNYVEIIECACPQRSSTHRLDDPPACVMSPGSVPSVPPSASLFKSFMTAHWAGNGHSCSLPALRIRLGC